MPQNVFFNPLGNKSEQNLLDDLVHESIGIYGIENNYIPCTYEGEDQIYGEDSLKKYEDHYPVSMYINNIDGFGGEGDLMSKFGVEIRDSMTLSISRREFDSYISTDTDLTRPREGDLIHFPLNNKVYKIMFVEHEPVFYQLGSLYFYELRVELFEYSNERFDTGIDIVDRLEDNLSLNIFKLDELLAESGLPLNTEGDVNINNEILRIDGASTFDADDVADSENDLFETEGDNILDFTDRDPFSEGGSF